MYGEDRFARFAINEQMLVVVPRVSVGMRWMFVSRTFSHVPLSIYSCFTCIVCTVRVRSYKTEFTGLTNRPTDKKYCPCVHMRLSYPVKCDSCVSMSASEAMTRVGTKGN